MFYGQKCLSIPFVSMWVFARVCLSVRYNKWYFYSLLKSFWYFFLVSSYTIRNIYILLESVNKINFLGLKKITKSQSVLILEKFLIFC